MNVGLESKAKPTLASAQPRRRCNKASRPTRTATMSSSARVQHFWNEWEIQCLVLASFSLQVFLFLFAGIRKRNTSRVLNFFLWVAYLLADYVATFLLGRLTLHISDQRHQLVLFWAPFLLLHLGGQDTITAFSMEDNTLWKRHLLSLVSQVALAIYVVAKSWRGNKQLLAPMALMFISGTLKYAERTWALMTASNSMTPGSSSIADHVLNLELDIIDESKSYFKALSTVFSSELEHNYENLVRAAGKGLRICLDFVVDMIPFLVWHDNELIRTTLSKLRSLQDNVGAEFTFKLAEIQLSLIYDYLYTKYGALHFHLNLFISGMERLITFGTTSMALALFARAHLKGLLLVYARVDVILSYTLLVGAVTLEISAMFMVISSFWPYIPLRDSSGLEFPFPGRSVSVLFSLVKCSHPRSKQRWSGKMAQYNLIDQCIKEEQAGLLTRTISWIGIKHDTTHVAVSCELKQLIFDKLLQVASTRNVLDYWGYDLSKFTGQWLKWELEARGDQGSMIAEKLLNDSVGSNLSIPMTVGIWHIATGMCFFTDKNVQSSPLRTQSMELSNYVMYLVAKCSVMTTTNGHFELGKARRQVRRILSNAQFVREENSQEQEDVLRYAHRYETEPIFSRARAVVNQLLKIQEAAERWELIATVWVEMLCYLGPNCGAGFHTKHLSTGGELVTHVRILLIILGVPLLENRPSKF